MDLSKLNKNQLDIAIKVAEAAQRRGLNPDFVLPMVMQESGFDPNAVSPKGAIGVMQLMPDTAKSLKADPKNIDENIDGGMRLLKELIENPKIGNDPYKVLAAYNTSTETRNKFLESGDLSVLPKETINHMIKVSEFFGGELPPVTGTAKPESAPEAKPEQAASVEPSDEVDEGSTENIYGGTPVTEYAESSGGFTPGEVGSMSGLAGAGAGAIYSAKAPAFRVAQRIGLLPGGKPISPQDAVELAGRVVPEATTSGGKWAAKTGYGMGEGTVQETSSRYQRSMPSGKVSGRMAKRFGPALPGESPDLTQRLIDRSAAQSKAEAEAAAAAAKARSPGPISRFTGSVAGSSPVVGGLAAYGTGYNLQDAYNKLTNQDTTGAIKSGIGALASAASLSPKAAPYAGSVAATIDAERRLQDKDYIGAGTSALGAIAPYAAPFVFGPQVGIPVGIATALGAPVVNELKDYLQRQGNKPAAP